MSDEGGLGASARLRFLLGRVLLVEAASCHQFLHVADPGQELPLVLEAAGGDEANALGQVGKNNVFETLFF